MDREILIISPALTFAFAQCVHFLLYLNLAGRKILLLVVVFLLLLLVLQYYRNS